jgi:hypothetical protein
MNFKNKLAIAALSVGLLCSSVSQAVWYDELKDIQTNASEEVNLAVDKAYADYNKSKDGKSLIALESAINDFVQFSANIGSALDVAYYQSIGRGARQSFESAQAEQVKSYPFSSTMIDLEDQLNAEASYNQAYVDHYSNNGSWFTLKNAAIATTTIAVLGGGTYGVKKLYDHYANKGLKGFVKNPAVYYTFGK